MDITISAVGVLAALALCAVLAYKNVFPPIFCVISVVLIAVTSQINVSDALTQSYVSGVGGMITKMFMTIVFGGVFGEIYAVTGAALSISLPLTKILRGPKSTIAGILFLGGLLRFAGLSVGAFFILYPIAVALFREYKINRRLLIVSIIHGTFVWAMVVPFNMNNTNILCMNQFGTPSSAGLIPGLVGTIVCVAAGLAYLFWQNNAYNQKDPDYMKMYDRDVDIPGFDAQSSSEQLPFFVALLPIIIVVLAFNVLKLDIGVAMVIGIISCMLLFAKRLSGEKWKDTLSAGARKAYVPLLNLACLTGLGTVIRLTPLYNAAVAWLETTSLNPYVLAGIAGNLIAFLVASGTSGVSVGLTALGDVFAGFAVRGYDLGNIHRILCFGGIGLDTVPWNGSLISYCAMGNSSIKESYMPIFWACTVIPLLTTFLVVIPLASLGLT